MSSLDQIAMIDELSGDVINILSATNRNEVTSLLQIQVNDVDGLQDEIDAKVSTNILDAQIADIFGTATSEYNSFEKVQNKFEGFSVTTISDFQTAVDARVQLIVGAAPGALDTLVEIAAQLSTDESAVGALTTTVSGKVDKTTTVNGHALSGNVTVTKSDVSLGNADNTSDANKPVSTATQTELDKKSKAYEGTTLRNNAFPIFKSATVSSGTAVFHLTADGSSGGTALFPNAVITDSVNAFVSDAAASYQMACAFSNSNKTVTVTTNKLGTANILTGILGQVAGNGAVVKFSVWGY